MVSPFQWKVRPASNVMTGSALGGACCELPIRSRNSSGFSRRRTFSWATMNAPALPRFSLPPVWSPCQCVLSTQRTGSRETAATAAWIFSVSGANWSSTRKAPSGPTERPRFPPWPLSIQMPLPRSMASIRTWLKSVCRAAAATGSEKMASAATGADSATGTVTSVRFMAGSTVGIGVGCGGRCRRGA